MRFWIVQKQDTVDAIIDAINAGTCTTESQVEAIAAQMDDTVAWTNPRTYGEEV